MSGDGTIKIFAGSASKEFAAQMCDYLGSPMGKCTTHIFSEGNTFVRIDESIRDKDVYFVQTLGLDPNNEFTELLFFLDSVFDGLQVLLQFGRCIDNLRQVCCDFFR